IRDRNVSGVQTCALAIYSKIPPNGCSINCQGHNFLQLQGFLFDRLMGINQKQLPGPKISIHRVFHTGVYLSTGLWVRVLYQPRDIPSNLASKCPSMYLSPSLPIPNSLMNWSLSSLDLKHTRSEERRVGKECRRRLCTTERKRNM